jgi:hypothetical protein
MSGRFQPQKDINRLKGFIQLLRQNIDLSENIFDDYVDLQSELDEDVAKGEITDGEYLIKSNMNLAKIRELEECIKQSSRKLKSALLEHKKAVRAKAWGGEDSDSD